MEEAVKYLLQDHLYRHIVIVCLCVAGMLFAMLVDLIFGVKKARLLGQATTSTGYKKTCEKGKKYFTPFAVLMCIDLISSVILPAPFFSMLWSAYCLFCEFKSVREKSWTKAELRKAERTMNIVIENKEDIAKLVAQLVLGEKQKLQDNNTKEE